VSNTAASEQEKKVVPQEKAPSDSVKKTAPVQNNKRTVAPQSVPQKQLQEQPKKQQQDQPKQKGSKKGKSLFGYTGEAEETTAVSSALIPPVVRRMVFVAVIAVLSLLGTFTMPAQTVNIANQRISVYVGDKKVDAADYSVEEFLRLSANTRASQLQKIESQRGRLVVKVGETEYVLFINASGKVVALNTSQATALGAPVYPVSADGVLGDEPLYYAQETGSLTLADLNGLKHDNATLTLYRQHKDGKTFKVLGVHNGQEVMTGYVDAAGNVVKYAVRVGEKADATYKPYGDALAVATNKLKDLGVTLRGNEPVYRVYNGLTDGALKTIASFGIDLGEKTVSAAGKTFTYRLFAEFDAEKGELVGLRGIDRDGNESVSFNIFNKDAASGEAYFTLSADKRAVASFTGLPINNAVFSKINGYVTRLHGAQKPVFPQVDNALDAWHNSKDASVTWLDPMGNTIAKKQKTASGDLLTVSVYWKARAVKSYQYIVTSDDAKGKASMKAATMQKVDDLNAKIDERNAQANADYLKIADKVTARDGNFYVNGKKFVFRGVTTRTLSRGDVQLLDTANVNVVRTYEPIRDRGLLDLLAQQGIRVVMGIDYSQMLEPTWNDYFDQFARHPAIFAFNITNELALTTDFQKQYGANADNVAAQKIEAVAQILKQEYPGIVLTTAVADVNAATYLRTCLSLDGVGVNMYRGPNAQSYVSAIKQWREANPDAAVFVSEIGPDAYDDGAALQMVSGYSGDQLLQKQHEQGVIRGKENQQKFFQQLFADPSVADVGVMHMGLKQDPTKPESILAKNMPNVKGATNDRFTEKAFGMFDEQGKPFPVVSFFAVKFENSRLLIKNLSEKMRVFTGTLQVNALNGADQAEAAMLEQYVANDVGEYFSVKQSVMSETPVSFENRAKLINSFDVNVVKALRGLKLDSAEKYRVQFDTTFRKFSGATFDVGMLSLSRRSSSDGTEFIVYRFDDRIIGQHDVNNNTWQLNLAWDVAGNGTRSIMMKNGQVVSESNSTTMTKADFMRENSLYMRKARAAVAEVYQELTGSERDFDAFLAENNVVDGTVIPVVTETFFAKNGTLGAETISDVPAGSVTKFLRPNDPYGATFMKKNPSGDGFSWEFNLKVDLKDKSGKVMKLPVGITAPVTVSLNYEGNAYKDYHYAVYDGVVSANSLNNEIKLGMEAHPDKNNKTVRYEGEFFKFRIEHSEKKVASYFTKDGRPVKDVYAFVVSEPLRGAVGVISKGEESIYFDPSNRDYQMPYLGITRMNKTDAENFLYNIENMEAWALAKEGDNAVRVFARREGTVMGAMLPELKFYYDREMTQPLASDAEIEGVYFVSKSDFSVKYESGKTVITSYESIGLDPSKKYEHVSTIENGLLVSKTMPDYFGQMTKEMNKVTKGFLRNVMPFATKAIDAFFAKIDSIQNGTLRFLATMGAFVLLGGFLFGLWVKVSGAAAEMLGKISRRKGGSKDPELPIEANMKDMSKFLGNVEKVSHVINGFAAELKGISALQKDVVDLGAQYHERTLRHIMMAPVTQSELARISKLHDGAKVDDIAAAVYELRLSDHLAEYMHEYERWLTTMGRGTDAQKYAEMPMTARLRDAVLMATLFKQAEMSHTSNAFVNFYAFDQYRKTVAKSNDEAAALAQVKDFVVRFNTVLRDNEKSDLAALHTKAYGAATRMTVSDFEDLFSTKDVTSIDIADMVKIFAEYQGHKTIANDFVKAGIVEFENGDPKDASMKALRAGLGEKLFNRLLDAAADPKGSADPNKRILLAAADAKKLTVIFDLIIALKREGNVADAEKIRSYFALANDTSSATNKTLGNLISKTYHDASKGYLRGFFAAYHNAVNGLFVPIAAVAVGTTVAALFLPAASMILTVATLGAAVATLFLITHVIGSVYIKMTENAFGCVNKNIKYEKAIWNNPEQAPDAVRKLRAFGMVVVNMLTKAAIDGFLIWSTASILFAFSPAGWVSAVAYCALALLMYFIMSLDMYAVFYAVEAGLANLIGKFRGSLTVDIGSHLSEKTLAKAEKKFVAKILPQKKHVKDDKGNIVLADFSAEEKKIAWANAWNLVVQRFMQDNVISPQQASQLSYGVERKKEAKSFLDATVTKLPELDAVSLPRDVRWRMSSYFSTLDMDLDRMPLWENIPDFSTITPHYAEVIKYLFSGKSEQDYEAANAYYKDTNHTLLTFLISRPSARTHWENVIASMTAANVSAKEEKKDPVYSAADIKAVGNLRRGEVLEFSLGTTTPRLRDAFVATQSDATARMLSNEYHAMLEMNGLVQKLDSPRGKELKAWLTQSSNLLRADAVDAFVIEAKKAGEASGKVAPQTRDYLVRNAAAVIALNRALNAYRDYVKDLAASMDDFLLSMRPTSDLLNQRDEFYVELHKKASQLVGLGLDGVTSQNVHGLIEDMAAKGTASMLYGVMHDNGVLKDSVRTFVNTQIKPSIIALSSAKTLEQYVLIGSQRFAGDASYARIVQAMNAQDQVRNFLSLHQQPMYRTARGIMDQRVVLSYVARLNFPTDDVIPDGLLDKETLADSDNKIDALVNDKYKYFWGQQIFGDALTKEDAKHRYMARDVLKLVKENPSMTLTYLQGNKFGRSAKYHKGDVPQNLLDKDGNPDMTKVLFVDYGNGGKVDGYISIGKTVETNVVYMFGQGKPMNQNNILRFATGRVIQFTDMNMDFFREEAFKVPAVVSRFVKDKKLAILGVPEQISTEETSEPGFLHAFADRTFNLISQRITNFVATRFHYGHPDFFRSSLITNLGLIIPNYVNEDIFGGIKALLSGYKIDITEHLQMPKMREVSNGGIYGFNLKMAMGGVEQAMSRWTDRLGTGIGQARMTVHSILGLGTYMKKFMVPFFVCTYIAAVSFGGISSFAAFPSAIIFGVIGVILSQSVALPGLARNIEDYGLWRGTLKFVAHYPALVATFAGQLYPTYQPGTFMANEGDAKYVATNRVLGLQHEEFADTVRTVDYYSGDANRFAKDGNSRAFISENGEIVRPKVASELYQWAATFGENWGVLNLAFIVAGFQLWLSWGLIWSALFFAVPVTGMIAQQMFNPGALPIGITPVQWWKNYVSDTKRIFTRAAMEIGVIPFRNENVTNPLQWLKSNTKELIAKIGIPVAIAGAMVVAGHFFAAASGWLPIFGALMVYYVYGIVDGAVHQKRHPFVRMMNYLTTSTVTWLAQTVVSAVMLVAYTGPVSLWHKITGTSWKTGDAPLAETPSDAVNVPLLTVSLDPKETIATEAKRGSDNTNGVSAPAEAPAEQLTDKQLIDAVTAPVTETVQLTAKDIADTTVKADEPVQTKADAAQESKKEPESPTAHAPVYDEAMFKFADLFAGDKDAAVWVHDTFVPTVMSDLRKTKDVSRLNELFAGKTAPTVLVQEIARYANIIAPDLSQSDVARAIMKSYSLKTLPQDLKAQWSSSALGGIGLTAIDVNVTGDDAAFASAASAGSWKDFRGFSFKITKMKRYKTAELALARR
jgi:hypothetical protein